MKTYQDLLAIGEDEKERMQFCLAVIKEHKERAVLPELESYNHVVAEVYP